ARPEWYFLFLFQLLKYFPGEQILVGTFFIPNGVMLLLFLLPFLGIGRLRKFGHFFGILVVVGLLACVVILTMLSIAEDSPGPILWGKVGNKGFIDENGKLQKDPPKDPQDKILFEKVKHAYEF